MQRKIVRIVTPGTTFSDHILEPGKSNFIAALYSNENSIAVAFAELSTGESFVQEFSSIESAEKEITLRDTAEVLLTPDQFKKYSHYFNYFSGALSRHFMPDEPEEFCINFFRVKTLKAFGIESNEICIAASSLLFSFLEETQKMPLSHLSGISYRAEHNSLSLDNDTIRNLEIFSSSDGNKKNGLLSHINYTKTAMGSRALHARMLQPFAKKSDIVQSQNQIESLVNDDDLSEIMTQSFSSIADLERIIARISTNRASPSDYVLLQKSLEQVHHLADNMNRIECEHWQEWKEQLGKHMQ